MAGPLVGQGCQRGQRFVDPTLLQEAQGQADLGVDADALQALLDEVVDGQLPAATACWPRPR